MDYCKIVNVMSGNKFKNFTNVFVLITFLVLSNSSQAANLVTTHGVAAITSNLDKNAISKLKNKNCDWIIANDVSKKGIGFNSDYNKISVIDKKGNIKKIPKNKKSFIANKIAELLVDQLLVDDRNIN